MVSEALIQQAWREAAADLGIVVVAPAHVQVGSVSVLVLAHLPQFGGPRGMVVFGAARPVAPHDAEALVAAGYGYSRRALPARYDRTWFVGLLDDWGWNRPDELPPSWFEGPDLDADGWA